MNVDEKLENIELPKKLYKYFGNIKYVIKALENNGIYMDNPLNFNDPFDEMCTPMHIGCETYKTWETFQEIMKCYLSNSEYIEKYWGEINFRKTAEIIFNSEKDWIINLDSAVSEFIRISGFDKIPKSEIISEIRKKRYAPLINICNESLRISCFSATNKSHQMWAYYANNHSGICLEYDTTLLDYSTRRAIKPVSYSKHRNADCVHFHKHDEWKIENEWRIIKQKDDNEISSDSFFPFDCVSGIYFGVRYDFSNNPLQKTVWSIPKSFLDKKYTYYTRIISAVKKMKHPVVLYQADTDLKDYEIVFTPFYKFEGNKCNEI